MSHIAQQKGFIIGDIEALKSAAENLGFKIKKNTQAKYYYGRTDKTYPLVIEVPDSDYSIGVNVTEEGYVFEYDTYGSNGSTLVKADEELRKEYLLELVRKEYGGLLARIDSQEIGDEVLITVDI